MEYLSFLMCLILSQAAKCSYFFLNKITRFGNLWRKGLSERSEDPDLSGSVGNPANWRGYAPCSMRFLGLLFFLMAFLVSISRIYLLQHFFVDTYFGAIIGVVTTLICYHLFERSEKLTGNKVLNSSLVYHFKKMITR